jgi:hypothetical protein
LEVRVLTLTQPWATLIAIGQKRIETRPRRTNHRGPLLIHAGLSTDAAEYFWDDQTFREPLTAAGYHAPSFLPYGQIVAACRVEDCLPTREIVPLLMRGCPLPQGQRPADCELAFGDYSDGRFGYVLNSVREIHTMSARGKQGLWKHELTEQDYEAYILPLLSERITHG